MPSHVLYPLHVLDALVYASILDALSPSSIGCSNIANSVANSVKLRLILTAIVMEGEHLHPDLVGGKLDRSIPGSI